MAIPNCFAKTAKIYTDEFLFVNSYLECLLEYSDTSSAYFIYIQLAPIEKDIYYSSEEVINSTFMKQLKKEQEFISGMIRKMEKYVDSPITNIKNAANAIVKRYQKELDINTKAQDSYFYIKTRQFKAGLLTADELSEAKDAIKPDTDEVTDLIYDILFPENSDTLKITYQERESLRGQVNNLKQKYQEMKFTLDLALKSLEDLLNSNIPRLKNINQ